MPSDSFGAAMRPAPIRAAMPVPPPPAPKPLAAIVNHVPTDQFDRGIDELKTNPSGGGGRAFTPPLWLSQVNTTNVIVSAGTVNAVSATNTATNISISSDATWNIYMSLTLPSSGIPSAAAVVASTSAIPSDTSTAAYRRIGTVVRASGAITSVTPTMAWSQEFVACGRDTADPTTTPGTYYWVVS